MLSFLNVPAKIIGILEANITPQEIAFGVCLGMFLGFTPLNGTTALLLALLFFVFKVNRMATLLTLPAFKALYILGVSKLGDATGSYLLEKANYLTGFWRVVTNFPIIAYLDVNRTTVMGGLFLSAVLSVPVYFIAKAIAAPLLAKYSEKMQNFVIIKPKLPKVKTGIMKRLNLGGIAVIITALLVIQIGVGLVISPLVSALVIDTLNKSQGTKISVERVNVWPLTLSFSMKELKIFDPKKPDKQIIRVHSASAHISPLALLSKRVVFSVIKMKGAEVDLEGESDGTYNIQHLASGAGRAEDVGAGSKPALGVGGAGMPNIMGLWRGAQEKKDLFGMIYGHIKNGFSKKGQDQAKQSRKNSKQVTRVTQDLPKGKLVRFKTPADMYMFEIRDLAIDGKVNVAPYNAAPVELRNARIILKKVAFDPQNGARLDGANIKGELFKDNTAAGKMDFVFSRTYTGAGQNAAIKADLDNIDLDAVRFVYEDSLPVRIAKGRISLSSRTKITGEALDSRNSITLTGHAFEPKSGGGIAMVGFVPMTAVCEALNQIDPVRLKFDITGTVEKPEFGGFQETLLGLIKPYVANIGMGVVKSQGVNALTSKLKSML